MSLYRYVKKEPEVEPPKKFLSPKIVFEEKKEGWMPGPKIIPILLVMVGVFFLANAAYPIISYQLFISPKFASSFVSPTTDSAIAQSFGTRSGGEDLFVSPAFESASVLGNEIDLLDLTKASNWFPQSNAVFNGDEVYSYSLSIPKLGIKEAQVIIGGEDLKKSLIQYPGTAVPGRFGNTVIFGHSVLPQFFNPKNYMTIFSTLPTLQQGSEIVIDYNMVRYKYLVEHMIEVAPNDISILAQRYDDSYLTLITCVPPGTYLKRLIIRARLVKI